MAKKSKLLTALDAHKGRDFEAEKKKKQIKAAEKRKRDKLGRNAVESEDDGSEAENGLNGTAVLTSPANKVPQDDFEAFSGDEEEDDDEEATLKSRPTNGTIPQPAEDVDASASEAEAESDVPLSDLSDEDLEDTIPHQRLTINNGPALLASQKRVAVVQSKPTTPFPIHNSLISTLPPISDSIPDANDDLTRELEFYRLARDAALSARGLLKAAKIPFTRPPDYFAEMVKTDEHMGLVKKKMYDAAAGKKAAEEARRLRDAKKFGKAVQIAKEQERAKDKRDTLDRIKDLKRKRKGNDTGLVRETELFITNNSSSSTTATGTTTTNKRPKKSSENIVGDDDLFQSITVESAPDKDRSGRERGNAGEGRGGRGGRGGGFRGSGSRGGGSDRGGRDGGRDGGGGGGERGRDANAKRQKKDSKFGFGGKKRFSKSGDAESTGDLRGFSSSRMKGRGGGGGGGGRGGSRGGSRGGRGGSGGGRARLGKSKRTAGRS